MVTLISRASIMRYPVVSYPIIGEFSNLSTVSSQNVYILQKEQGTPRFWRSLLEKCCQELVAAQVGGGQRQGEQAHAPAGERQAFLIVPHKCSRSISWLVWQVMPCRGNGLA